MYLLLIFFALKQQSKNKINGVATQHPESDHTGIFVHIKTEAKLSHAKGTVRSLECD